MLNSTRLNNEVSKLHERSLRIVYYHKKSSFKQVLERDQSVTKQRNNLVAILPKYVSLP